MTGTGTTGRAGGRMDGAGTSLVVPFTDFPLGEMVGLGLASSGERSSGADRAWADVGRAGAAGLVLLDHHAGILSEPPFLGTLRVDLSINSKRAAESVRLLVAMGVPSGRGETPALRIRSAARLLLLYRAGVGPDNEESAQGSGITGKTAARGVNRTYDNLISWGGGNRCGGSRGGDDGDDAVNPGGVLESLAVDWSSWPPLTITLPLKVVPAAGPTCGIAA